MATETWLPVSEYPGYEVSDLGRVRCWRRPGPFVGILRVKPKILKVSYTGGYAVVSFGHRKTRFIHTIVLETFVGPGGDLECRHLNGNKADPKLSNLKWGTSLENAEDRARHGTQAFGTRQPKAKLTDAKAREILAAYKPGIVTQAEVASRYGIDRKIVSRIFHKRSWRHALNG